MAKGYGTFAGLPPPVSIPFFGATTIFTKLPAFRNARLAKHWPASGNLKTGGKEIKNTAGKPPPGEPEQPCFPMLIFSHGLGGQRKCYSSVCGEFASYGFVVCAVEHRDGSGPRTYVNLAKEGVGSAEEREKTGGVDHNQAEREQGWEQIDYVFPKENMYDTSPNNEKGVDHELRNAQISLRLAELDEAYRVMCEICLGNGQLIEEKNLRKPPYKGSSSRGLRGVDWQGWKGGFHLDQVTMLGHSFGAATTVEVLRHSDRFKFISQGIIYDIWGAAINPPEDDPSHRIHTPLLGINSEAFMYWPSNFKAVTSLMEEAQAQNAPTWLLTVRGTVHISQSDYSILYRHLCAVLMKMTANPKRALDINIGATLEYLTKVSPICRAMAARSMPSEHFLDTACLETIPNDHRPTDNMLAFRLRIPHEFRNRVLPTITRKFKRKKQPRAPGTEGNDDEIWMHIKSETDVVDRFNDHQARSRSQNLEQVEKQAHMREQAQQRAGEEQSDTAAASEDNANGDAHTDADMPSSKFAAPAVQDHQEGAKVAAQQVHIDDSGTATFLKTENGRSKEQKETLERGEVGRTAVADESNSSGAEGMASKQPGKAFEVGEDDPM